MNNVENYECLVLNLKFGGLQSGSERNISFCDVVSIDATNSPSHPPTFTLIALQTHRPECSFTHNIYLPVSTHVGISGIMSSCFEKSGLAGI